MKHLQGRGYSFYKGLEIKEKRNNTPVVTHFRPYWFEKRLFDRLERKELRAIAAYYSLTLAK